MRSFSRSGPPGSRSLFLLSNIDIRVEGFFSCGQMLSMAPVYTGVFW